MTGLEQPEHQQPNGWVVGQMKKAELTLERLSAGFTRNPQFLPPYDDFSQ